MRPLRRACAVRVMRPPVPLARHELGPPCVCHTAGAACEEGRPLELGAGGAPCGAGQAAVRSPPLRSAVCACDRLAEGERRAARLVQDIVQRSLAKTRPAANCSAGILRTRF